jgi:hypothetical protein
LRRTGFDKASKLVSKAKTSGAYLQENFEAASIKNLHQSALQQNLPPKHQQSLPTMSTTEQVKATQQKWEQLSEWGAQNPEDWAKNELKNNEILLEGIEA